MSTKKFINDPKDIKLNTHDEVDQILGRPPRWILKWGIIIIFIFFCIFGALAYLIKYPDEISAKVSIITENPAIKVMARASGKIDTLIVTNNQIVQKGEPMAILDDPASFQDMETLSSFLNEINQNNEQLGKLHLPEQLQLGSIQTSYAALSQKIQDYNYFKDSENVILKIQSLKKQIKHKKELGKNLDKQKTTLSEETALIKKDVDRNRELNLKDIVSDMDLEKSEGLLLQQKKQLENLENQIVSNNISIEEIRGSIIGLQEERKDGYSDRQLNIHEDIEGLKSKIAQWKQNYVITAPITGRVSFSNIWSVQQFLNENDEVLTIVPSTGSGKVIAKALLPISNSGKVKTGQTVNLHLDGFPYLEYGIIKATIKHISLVPVSSGFQDEESYLVDIVLPDTLTTTYNKIIPFRQKMKGTAKIITEDRRIVERILDRVFSLLKNT